MRELARATLRAGSVEQLVPIYYGNRRGSVSLWESWRALLSSRISEGHRVLEIGSGPDNKYSKLLSSLSGHLVGLDVDDRVLSNQFLNEAFVYSGAEFPFQGGEFDAIVSHSVMEHVPRPGELLRECHRVLKPGGVFLSRQPNRLNPTVLMSSAVPLGVKHWVARILTGRDDLGRDFYPTHYRFNRASVCRRVLEQNGFAVEELSLWEGAPVYHANSRVVFLAQVAVERTLNSTDMLSGARSILQIAARRM